MLTRARPQSTKQADSGQLFVADGQLALSQGAVCMQSVNTVVKQESVRLHSAPMQPHSFKVKWHRVTFWVGPEGCFTSGLLQADTSFLSASAFTWQQLLSCSRFQVDGVDVRPGWSSSNRLSLIRIPLMQCGSHWH